MSEPRRIQAYVFDSDSGAVAKVNAPLLLAGGLNAAEYHEVIKAMAEPASKGSRRLKQRYGTQIDGVACAARPFDMALFAYAATINTYHSRAVRAKVKDIVGRPWMIAGDGAVAQKQRIEAFFRGAFGRRTYAEGMSCVWTDYEALGNGYLEVVPTKKGEPAELEHIPATETWLRLDGLGYVQQKAGEYSHFRAWGVPSEVYGALPARDPLSAEHTDVTAIVHFSRYSPWSPFYGIPAIMPAWASICLMTLVAEYNLNFFANNAIPDYAVILEGESDERAAETIRTYFKHHLKGQAHKTLVLDTPAGGKVRFEKLTDSNAREGSFRLLRTDCRDEILQAHGVPPQKVGIVETGKLGGNLSSEQIREYQISIVGPGQEAVTGRMDSLIQAGFGIDNLNFLFEPYDTEDRRANAEEDKIYLDSKVLTPNEVRAKRFPHLEPLEGGDEPLGGPTLADLTGLDQAMGELQQQVKEAVRR